MSLFRRLSSSCRFGRNLHGISCRFSRNLHGLSGNAEIRAFRALSCRFSSSFSGLSGNEDIRAFFDKLTASTNVSNYVELPMIAVMGDTSSGKSSLLSSISAVELPSSSELTTRCPIMLRMKRAEKQHATVSVQWKQIPGGKSKESIQFETRVVNEKDWALLPKFISEAQKHIIDHTGKEVARDIVHVKVEGPDYEDLTLVDLPGIVRSRGINEGETIVADINALIDDYLQNKRCVILAVVPANVDFHNSQIMADAQQVDPETKRTIPVITKPDLIDAGAEKEVEELLLGRKTTQFQMGFHMVKGRGQADLDNDVSIEDGLANEETFFQNTKPWRDATDRDLFGTRLLRKKLGELQLDLIRETLPAIIDEIGEKYKVANEELQTIGHIPKSNTEKRLVFHELREEIVSHLYAVLQGNSRKQNRSHKDISSNETFASKLHNECEDFQSALMGAKFSNISSVTENSDVLVLVEDGKVVRGKVVGTGEQSFFIDYEDRLHNRRQEFVLYYQQKEESSLPKTKGTTWAESNGNICIADGDGHYDELKPVQADKVKRDPAWVLPWIKRNRTDDLPVFVNKEVFQAIVNKLIDEEWLNPCQKLVKSAKKLLLVATEDALKSSLKLSQYPRFREILLQNIKLRAEGLVERAEKNLEHFIEKERNPYTQDHYLHENLSKQRCEPIFEALKIALGVHSGEFNSNEKITKTSVSEILNAVRDQNQRKSVDEHMAEDMQNTLDAYGKVALKRFVDGIPMECWNLLREFPQEVEDVLIQVSDDDVNRFIVAGTDIQQKEEELKVKVEELKAGMKVLESLK